jgi:ADP-ribosylglycohydrolase
VKFVEDRRNKELYTLRLKAYAKRFPQAGYGQMFQEWSLRPSLGGYHSFGNGSAMRVSSIGFAFDNLADVLKEARLSAIATHNHPEGIKGAQAVASAVFMAWNGESKEAIKQFIEQRFRYNLSRSLAQIRPQYTFDSFHAKAPFPKPLSPFLNQAISRMPFGRQFRLMATVTQLPV